MKRLILPLILLLIAGACNRKPVELSGNPLFDGWYADPEGAVFGDEYWIYPTFSKPYDEQLFMDAFSSKDLVHWTKHDKVISIKDISWLRRALWAPSVLERDGKYYLYFGANDMHEKGEGGIGVAVADNPAGPFKDALGHPLIDEVINGAQPIDQFVFKDDDGTYYMYYGGWRHCNMVRLGDDLMSIVPFEDGETFKEITPEGYVEGPFMLKRGDTYYFMWSEGGWTGPDYHVAYAMSKSPFGPFERIGTILESDMDVATGAGHHSVIKGPGEDEYYIIYHRHPLGSKDGNNRVVCIERMYFDQDGKILPVKITFDGVPASPLSKNASLPKSNLLPRAVKTEKMDKAMAAYLQAVKDCSEELHSIMVLQHGKVVAEEYFSGRNVPHVLHSVSKTFTSTAVGFAISEGLLHLDDKIVDLFPESVPENASDTLARITIRHLLTMNSGHGTDPTGAVRVNGSDWVRGFMEWPIEYEPGTCYCYNSLGTYVLSAAVQKVTGQKIVDYLDTRLWQPLGIEKPQWIESLDGINAGGWGLYLRTEDLAKMGLCLLNGGKYGGKQVIPAEWVKEMSANQVPSCPAGTNGVTVRQSGLDPATSDWLQGYGYQMWRCRHNAFRADGAYGQYILVLPEQDAVVVTTANIGDMQEELNLIWDNILPALQ